ncbi:glycosyltransferase family 25 protein [Acinetobacter sp. MB5]|uniref:glycosyltransferase family 25 protein n=1 Tax=Acinetobacter sp. MB5 TaxID=2069438 RepID=UPI000DD0A628|nr:glycosyltransferase family 25 protein [Acinetobacter sp. MB5]
MSKSSKVLFICISLKQSLERRKAIELEFNKLRQAVSDIEIELEFFDAIYGKDLSSEILALINIAREQAGQCKRPMSTGEIGCMLSHLFLWQRISEQRYANYDRVVIIEDDVYLAAHHQHTAQLHSILHHPAEFIFLSGHSKKARTRILGYISEDQTHFNMLGSRYQYTMACAYSITPNEAGKLVRKMLAKTTVADDWKFLLSEKSEIPYYYFFEQGGEDDSTIEAVDQNRQAFLAQYKENRFSKNTYKIWQDIQTFFKLLIKLKKIKKLIQYINNLNC